MPTVVQPPHLDAPPADLRLLPERPRLRIALLSTYPDTQCGLATFTAALREHLAPSVAAADVVRVLEEQSGRPAGEVVAHLVNGSARSAADAVRVLDTYDVVVVQHEYGIYGGPDGQDVLELLAALSVPVVVVLHTVLERPTTAQERILRRLLVLADRVVTMTDTAHRRLLTRYDADVRQLSVIPHGAVDHRGVTPRPRPDARPLVLTWGLLGPGKGIEWALAALPALHDLDPRYLVLGKTHPRVAERQGEQYRDGLLRRAAALGVQDLVELDASYLGVDDLAAVVASADVVLLPYDSRDQVTSGVLIEAVAAGRPVVSTAFPHAIELLADGAGLVVPQRDPLALEGALRRVLSEPGLAASMARAAALAAPGLLWGAVAGQYLDLTGSLATAA